MNHDVKNWLDRDGELFLRTIGIKKGNNVLDFGCGEGHYTIPLARIVSGEAKVYAFDKERIALNKVVKLAKERNIDNIACINGESRIPLKEASVDVALCYDVIHYVKDRKPIYREIFRILKGSGLLSVYPKHNKKDYPLMELANIEMRGIIKEIVETGFIFKTRDIKILMHDEYYNEGTILNFRRY